MPPHEPNFEPPATGPSFTLEWADGQVMTVTLDDLYALPFVAVTDCYIVSTGHGTSGPFTFGGARLRDLLAARLPPTLAWTRADVLSGDGFGTSLSALEILDPAPPRPILLVYTLAGQPLGRTQGLVRLIVPSETDDALRQVKWVGCVRVS